MLRKPNSIPKGDTIIEDPAIEPYFLVKSRVGGYVLYKRVTRGANNTEYIQTICYPGNFQHALRLLGEEMLNNGEKVVYSSLKNYIKEYNKIEERITSIKDQPIS